MGTPPFYFQDGSLFCEQTNVEELINSLPTRIHQIPIPGKCVPVEAPRTPIVLYSTAAIRNNTRSYLDAMRTAGLNGILGYAIKANGNLHIVKELKAQGVQMLITVSGYEIVAGLNVGFPPEDIIFNGNGKQRWEVLLAIELGVMLNVDSIFDAKQILELSQQRFPQKEVRVLLRVQPRPFECNVAVHPYVNTSESSKFGMDIRDMSQILDILQEHEKIKVEGIHCHLGSCIYDPTVYEYISAFVTDLSATLAKSGIHVKLLDLGGGIGINYHGTLPGIESFLTSSDVEVTVEGNIPGSISSASAKEPAQEIPSLLHFIQPMSRILQRNLKVLLEPGRSLVGNAGLLLTKVLGKKETRDKDYVVVDAAMNDLIRPCLYGAHHRIYPTRLRKSEEWKLYDVVGPVCETGDFLGRKIPLQSSLADYLAVMDCGAYGAAMSSNYNMRAKASEVLVDGTTWRLIGERQTYEDLTRNYSFA